MKKITFALLLIFLFSIILFFQYSIIAKTIYAIKDAEGNIVGATDINFLPVDMVEQGYLLEYLTGENPKVESFQESQGKSSDSEELSTGTSSTPQEASKTTYTQVNNQEFDEVIQIIRKNARKQWGNDEEMYNYEVKNQTTAYNWYKSETSYPHILKNAKAEWQDDYEMVKYEYEKNN